MLALQELVRKRRIEELKSLLGSVRLGIDFPKPRHRARDTASLSTQEPGAPVEMANSVLALQTGIE
ncbi:MAG TPA: hypothetical protein VLX28_24710 [Thermoanaerobaculia bacterium]|nr:hypothetical protein [Thermoanaerobaculia bacterium]